MIDVPSVQKIQYLVKLACRVQRKNGLPCSRFLSYDSNAHSHTHKNTHSHTHEP